MLRLKQVTKSYPMDGNRLIDIVHIPYFAMEAGEKTALVGPSGSGKSTLLHMIAGIVRPTGGTIRLLGEALEEMGEAALDRFRARHIGYVYQNFNLLPGFSALENVLAAMQFGGCIPARERRERAETLLAQAGLSHRLRHKPGQLSNGEQQRVAIARALANAPKLVLADEPTASLDSGNKEQVFHLLMEACRQQDAALLLCTHDLELAYRLDRVVRMSELSSGVKEAAR